jgi:hypothetical protein
VGLPYYAAEGKLSVEQAARWQRQRNLPLGDIQGAKGWPNYTTYTVLSKKRCVCEVDVA